MKKRFVVLIEVSTEDQNVLMLEWIKSEAIGWWHWFQNIWLLSNKHGHLEASTIRDKVREIYGTANVLVLEIKGTEDTWSGYGPKGENRNMFTWLRSDWNGG